MLELTSRLLGESGGDEVDPLDAYMKSVGDHMDTTKRSEIKHQLHDLRKVLNSPLHSYLSLCYYCYIQEEERIRKLISVAMPTALPSVERWVCGACIILYVCVCVEINFCTHPLFFSTEWLTNGRCHQWGMRRGWLARQSQCLVSRKIHHQFLALP